MTSRAAACVFVACACAFGSGCDDRGAANHTAVLGGSPPAAQPAGTQASVPAPPVPRTATPEIAITGPSQAVAVWEENGAVVSARYTSATGWSPAQPLERIGGEASSAKVASNGRGVAMAVWRHSVGRIDSLRFSRWQEGTGWSTPDVMPGALPRPRQPGKTAGGTVEKAAPRIEVDSQGNARAEWPSGFADNEMQVSTFVRGEGWARPVDVPLQQATQQSAASD